MKQEIRRAQRQDIAGINRLLFQVNNIHADGRPDLFVHGSKKYTDAQLEELLNDDSRPIFVFVNEESQVEGYAFCIFQENRENHSLTDIKTLYIDDICVDEACRGRHIGSDLYRHVLAFAKAQGCYNVTLNVWECNPGARKFYDAMGMKPQKTGMEVLL